MRVEAETSAAAWAFPGVATDWTEADRAFLERHGAAMRPFLDEASSAARTDLCAAVSNLSIAPLSPLAKEILTYAFDCAAARVCREAGLAPRLVAGYSMGLYAALWAARAIPFADGLAIVQAAHAAARDCRGNRPCGMAAVVGLSPADVEAILRSLQLRAVAVANVNNDYSVTLSGDADELALLLRRAERDGALKTVRLDVESPYHNPAFLEPAAAGFEEAIRPLDWGKAVCPVLASDDQRRVTEPQDLMRLTVANWCRPFHWQRTLECLADQGIQWVLECGPAVSLTQNARFVPSAPPHVNLKTIARRLGL